MIHPPSSTRLVALLILTLPASIGLWALLLRQVYTHLVSHAP